MSDRYQKLIDDLEKLGYLKTKSIVNAFRSVDRKFFVAPSLVSAAHANQPLPIGSGQTISQPLTVAFMIELLQPQEGNKILEIGAGSGWQTAILSKIIGKKGKIYAFEILHSIAEFGKNNIGKFKIDNVKYQQGDASGGYKYKAPYDRIIAGAAFVHIPKKLILQLKIGGILVAPTQDEDIRKITRIDDHKFDEKIIPGFMFVPITKDEKYNS